MPHSGGGGSHSGGSHSSGSHGGSGGSSASKTRVSSTPFHGCHTYVVYGKNGSSRLVYSDSSSYKEEMTKGQMIGSIIFGSIFMIPGVVELIILIGILISGIHFGVHATKVPEYVDNSVHIYDELDYVSDMEEARLVASLEEFRDKTGIIPAVEFTDTTWAMDFNTLEDYAYDRYVVNFTDEYHLLIVYSYGDENPKTGFNEFYWESMWGDDLGKTASGSDEEFLKDTLQANFSRANGQNVASAISNSFGEFFTRLDRKGFRLDGEMIFLVLFMLVHGGAFFGAGFTMIRGSIKSYKNSKEEGTMTCRIMGVPEPKACEYCNTTYYKGTVGNCPNCGAPLGL